MTFENRLALYYLEKYYMVESTHNYQAFKELLTPIINCINF